MPKEGRTTPKLTGEELQKMDSRDFMSWAMTRYSEGAERLDVRRAAVVHSTTHSPHGRDFPFLIASMRCLPEPNERLYLAKIIFGLMLDVSPEYSGIWNRCSAAATELSEKYTKNEMILFMLWILRSELQPVPRTPEDFVESVVKHHIDVTAQRRRKALDEFISETQPQKSDYESSIEFDEANTYLDEDYHLLKERAKLRAEINRRLSPTRKRD